MRFNQTQPAPAPEPAPPHLLSTKKGVLVSLYRMSRASASGPAVPIGSGSCLEGSAGRGQKAAGRGGRAGSGGKAERRKEQRGGRGGPGMAGNTGQLTLVPQLLRPGRSMAGRRPGAWPAWPSQRHVVLAGRGDTGSAASHCAACPQVSGSTNRWAARQAQLLQRGAACPVAGTAAHPPWCLREVSHQLRTHLGAHDLHPQLLLPLLQEVHHDLDAWTAGRWWGLLFGLRYGCRARRGRQGGRPLLESLPGLPRHAGYCPPLGSGGGQVHSGQGAPLQRPGCGSAWVGGGPTCGR